jgi:glycerol-3-phosphate dehydrogenase
LNNSITSEPDHGKVNDSHTEQSLSKSFPIFKKDVILAVEEEMAITTEDVLSRRTRLLLLDAGEAIRISEKVSDMIAVLRNKNEDWKNQDTLSFRKLAENYIFSDKQQSD